MKNGPWSKIQNRTSLVKFMPKLARNIWFFWRVLGNYSLFFFWKRLLCEMVVELQGPMGGKNTATVLEVGGNGDCGWRALAFMIAAQNANRNVTTTEQLIDKMDALLKPWEQRWPTTSCPSTMGTSLGPRPKCNFTLARAKRTHLWRTVLVDDLFEFSSFNARLKDCMHLDHLRFRVWPI